MKSGEVRLELLAECHARELYDLTEQNRTYLRRWLPWLDAISGPADTHAFVLRTMTQYAEGRGPNYAVFYDNQLCGIAGYHAIDPHSGMGSIGYWLAESYVGRGIMTGVVERIVREGFLQLNLKVIEVRCATQNIRSRAIPERLGLRLDRVVKDAEWLYDHHVDHAVYVAIAA